MKKNSTSSFPIPSTHRTGPPGRGTRASANCLPRPGKRLRPLFGLSGRGSRRTGRRDDRPGQQPGKRRIALQPVRRTGRRLPCLGPASRKTHRAHRRVEVGGKTNLQPVSPCGACRQAILEYAQRQNSPIDLLFAGSGPAPPSRSALPTCCLSASAAKTSWDKSPSAFFHPLLPFFPKLPPRIVFGANPHLAPQVGQRISRIVPQHPRPGIPHHLPDPLPHRRSITMHPTRGTVRFFTPERASLQPSQGIVAQFLAPGTKFPPPAAVPSPAVQPDHPLHHPPLTLHGLSPASISQDFHFSRRPFSQKSAAR